MINEMTSHTVKYSCWSVYIFPWRQPE